MRIVNVYGWTGAHQPARAQKKANMFNIIKAELDAQSECPTFIMGDFNGGIEDFPTLAKLIDEEGWSDLGAIAGQWGQMRCEPTCWPNNSEPSRRDYIIANALALCFG